MAEVLLRLIRGISASQRQQLAGSESLPCLLRNANQATPVLPARLTLGPPEPAHRQSQGFGKPLSVCSVSPASASQPFCKPPQRQAPSRAGTPCQAARGRVAPPHPALAASPSPSLCLSRKVTLPPGLTIISVICPCGN